MALIAAIAGPYSGTYNGNGIGQTREGWELFIRWHFERLDQSHLYGRSLIDAVYLGGDVSLIFEGIEYASGLTAVAWPFSATVGLMGVVGRMADASSIVKALVLTAASGTTAASSPASLTASKSVISEQSRNALKFAPSVRRVPIEMMMMPYDTGAGAIGWFTTT
ncbi:MAG: hypothetical protein IT428_19835 [Planctomycetaceae bacterium]|nr:hypothetical protein [Planctomycetaceae bacterium]